MLFQRELVQTYLISQCSQPAVLATTTNMWCYMYRQFLIVVVKPLELKKKSFHTLKTGGNYKNCVTVYILTNPTDTKTLLSCCGLRLAHILPCSTRAHTENEKVRCSACPLPGERQPCQSFFSLLQVQPMTVLATGEPQTPAIFLLQFRAEGSKSKRRNKNEPHMHTLSDG